MHAELLKLSTTRTFAALAGTAVGISLLTNDVSGVFILVLAVVGITGEWRHRTITSSLLAAPDRLRFLAAKRIAFAAAGLLLSLLVSLAVAVVGFAILSVRDLPTPDVGELAGQIARIALVAALLGGFGVVVGALVRNQVVAVVGMLLLSFVVEPAVIGLPEGAAGRGNVDLLPAGLAISLLLAWIGAAFAAGLALLRRRDVG